MMVKTGKFIAAESLLQQATMLSKVPSTRQHAAYCEF